LIENIAETKWQLKLESVRLFANIWAVPTRIKTCYR